MYLAFQMNSVQKVGAIHELPLLFVLNSFENK